MSYYPKGHHDDDGAEFDEYDPTPYGGGYDIALTYGRPLPPSEETCYQPSSASDEFDYDRPQYTSYAEPSAYGDEALDNEYQSYSRPKPRPTPSYRPSEESHTYEQPQADYGFQPGVNRPGGESEYGRKSEYEEEPTPEYGSGYGRKSEYEEPKPQYGSGYGRKSEYEEPSSEYGSGYGRKSEYEEPTPQYGSGYGRKSEYQEPSSEYGRKTEYEEPTAQYGRKSEYEEPASEYGSGYRKKSEYEEPSSEYGSGYGRKNESEEYGSGGYGRKPSYGQEEGERPSYGRPSYQAEEGEGYERPHYGRSEEEDYKKPSYERRGDDDEGYGRKKYVSTQTQFLFFVLIEFLALDLDPFRFTDIYCLMEMLQFTSD
ncbi:hypothetical protein KY290_008939 [Solanum tuberosum]|uniref:Pro-resilin n=1 Tax=Solanum tuberosum TaxID=4113 RepID=A0ABQ7WA10_SOLTU|nr:hypothetical protein KY289_008774 [Solanum tuberosum]KAH0715872.1 hypothetical protein KY284_008777 [Solanum tuberosum]KAH0745450.1 hypothetical protein KY285_007107 [Solanum tuberosum]KAH0777528.1 hypothetical protein KY290_008939 [Solanum tuberosum]